MTDRASGTVVVSENERERVDKLGIAFREQLQHWMTGVVVGVRYSDEVARELAMACFEIGIVAFLTGQRQLVGPEQPIEQRCADILVELMKVIESEVAS